MTRSNILTFFLLAPLYAAVLLAGYWLLIDTDPPLTVEYQHPRFLLLPARSRDEARQYEISEAPSGGTVYVYRETCRTKNTPGEGRPVWRSGAFEWGGPQRTVPGHVGCVNRSTEVDAPTTSPSREFTYLMTASFQVNPLHRSEVAYPPIPLRVLSPQDAKRGGGK